MKRLLIILSCIGFLVAPVTGYASETRVTIETDDSHDVFTGLFRSVWAKLNSITPRNFERPIAMPVATAGIRGSDSSGDVAHLYWKDDSRLQAEIVEYQAAQHRLDRGEMDAAIDAFEDFLELYPDSSLRPNAMLGRSMGLAGIGRDSQSVAGLQEFVDAYPRHSLADDARQLITALRAEGRIAVAPAQTTGL